MHPRNVFSVPPDYTELAIKYKEFREVCGLDLGGKVYVDYKKELALRNLTKVLLKEYFELDIEFAPGSLVPTVPLRLNYILWLEDLLEKYNFKNDLIKGIDIGSGSSCIYSLLGAKKNSWHMLALESKEDNIDYARENIARNHLNDFIKLFGQRSANVIFKDFFDLIPSEEIFHFCLCNPPFYDASLKDRSLSNRKNRNKRPPPRNCPTGTTDELFCEGGEVAFVQQIIVESFVFKDKIRIYTSMLGHKSNLAIIIKELKSKGISNFCTTDFSQGNTTRWGVAWSHIPDIDLIQFQSK